MNNSHTAPLRDQIAAQARRIKLLNRRNLELRRAIAEALELIAEALTQPHPHGLMSDARDVLAAAQPQADVQF